MPGSENHLPLPIYCFCPFFKQPHPVPIISASHSFSSEPNLRSPFVHTQIATTELAGHSFSVQNYTVFAQVVSDFVCVCVDAAGGARKGRGSTALSAPDGAGHFRGITCN